MVLDEAGFVVEGGSAIRKGKDEEKPTRQKFNTQNWHQEIPETECF